MQLTKVGKRQLEQHQQRFFPKTAGKRALSRGFIQSRSCLNVTIGGTGSSMKRISMRHCQHNERTAHKGRGKRGPTPATLGTQSVPVAQSQKRKNQQFPWLGPKTSNNKRRPKLFSHFLVHALEIPQPGQPRGFSPFAPARFLRLGWMKRMMGCLCCGGAAAGRRRIEI
jgi:hypothetical protein